jgi:hypothetical protein
MTGWPGRNTHLAAQDAPALVATDDPRRSPPFVSRWLQPLFLRRDSSHELPIIVQTADGEIVARFGRLGDAAKFLSPETGPTLPQAFVDLCRALGRSGR